MKGQYADSSGIPKTYDKDGKVIMDEEGGAYVQAEPSFVIKTKVFWHLKIRINLDKRSF
jgi:hypothetical protein